jgi:hypothetical protein
MDVFDDGEAWGVLKMTSARGFAFHDEVLGPQALASSPGPREATTATTSHQPRFFSFLFVFLSHSPPTSAVILSDRAGFEMTAAPPSQHTHAPGLSHI